MAQLFPPDFLIIGAGVIGLSTAYELSRRGASVVVLDRGLVGRESSWAGAGILSALLPWDYAPSVNRLTALGAAAYPTWVAGLEAASGWSVEFLRSGLLVKPPFDAKAAVEWCAENAVRAEITPEKNLYLPDVAQVRPPRLIAALKQALRNSGVEIREGVEALQLEIKPGQVTGVTTGTGTLHASQYVLTSGAWINNLLNNINNLSGLRPVRGEMLLFKAEAGALKSILYQDGKYLVPRADGHILVGSTLEETGFDQRTTEAAKRALHQAGATMFAPLAALQPVAHWAGLRPGSMHNIPLICRHPDWKNAFINAGHFRYGLTMAPAAATLLAEEIFGEPSLIPLEPYQLVQYKS